MKIIVTGGRDYQDLVTVRKVLSEYHQEPRPILVHGGARGADRIAAYVARELGWHVVAYPADWRRHGRAAGPIRNQEMADAGADLCIAFPGGRGTADAVGGVASGDRGACGSTLRRFPSANSPVPRCRVGPGHPHHKPALNKKFVN